MQLHCLIENTCSRDDLVAEHGLSLLIETANHRILFDTGASAAFIHNATRMGHHLNVDMVVLSHGHYDHGGGLRHFIQLHPHTPIWVSPHAFTPHFNAHGKNIGLQAELEQHPSIHQVRQKNLQLASEIYIHDAESLPTPYQLEGKGMTCCIGRAVVPDDFLHEQYLLLKENGRRIIISGCAHRGILNIATHFRPDVLIGGFHLTHADSQEDIDKLHRTAALLAQLPTSYYTGHCTCPAAYAILKQHLGTQLHPLTTGDSITIP